ncbi:MAG TPA: hypothetical protein VMT62_08490, partial [Syntrophorhabdaceae bacterium]|nr:hypothetical protein [Syntrophorhabdaceae bacterium]
MKRLFFILALSVLLPVVSWSACSKDERTDFAGWDFLWTYSGSIGELENVALTLSFDNNTLSAVLFDPISQSNIRLEGQIFDDGRINLRSTENAEPKIMLEGEFLETDPRGKFRSKLNCEVLSGNYTSPLKQDKFIFGAEYGYGGSIDHRYSRIGADDDACVEREAKRFIEAVARRDKQTVANCMNYPVRVNGIRGHKTIYNKKQLLKDYDRIFKPEFSKAISLSRPYHMFVTKYEQAVLGHGLVAFVG